MRRTLALLALLTVAGVWSACSPAENTNTNSNMSNSNMSNSNTSKAGDNANSNSANSNATKK